MSFVERYGNVAGAFALPVLALGAWLALAWSPPEVHMGQDVRLLYVHVPTILVGMYVAFPLTAIAGVMFLWKKDLRWDNLAVASAEVGVVFTAIAVVVGSIWGKLTWGVYWVWDPRLTTTAVLIAVFGGYLLLRALSDDPWVRARISAVVAIFGCIDIPVVYYSVLWWRSLHEQPMNPLQDPTMDDRMELALVVNLIAFTLVFLFLLSKRLRLARLQRELEAIDWSPVQASRANTLEPVRG